MLATVELTNMCMIFDRENNRVLVQERVKSWKGFSFPGGHVEGGEGIVESTIREIKEETGLEVTDLKACGVIHWYNEDTSQRYFVFNYKTECFSGELLQESDEGKNLWVSIDQLKHLDLSPGLKERLPMFLEDQYCEGFGIWSERRKPGPIKLF